MNLSFINPSRTPRPEIYGLSKHLASKRNNIIILQPSDDTSLGDSFCLQKNVHVKYIRSKFMRLGDSIITVPLFGKWIDTLDGLVQHHQCDLIHVCDYEYLTSILPILVKHRYRNIPITIVNDTILGAPDSSLGSLPMEFLSKVYTRTLGTMILRSYDKVVFLYSKLVEDVQPLGLPMEKIEIIPNGIDMEAALSCKQRLDVEKTKKKYGISENEKVILFVGRLVKVKRAEIVINLLKKLLDQGLKAKALIVGVGPQRAKIEKISGQVRHNVVFTGYLQEKNKFECYGIADLLVLPSLSEGLPTVLLEAASFGLPMVATRTNGTPDIVVHGYNGFLVDRWNYSQYSKFVQQILEDEDLSRKMSINAQRHVEKNFSWDTITKKYEAVYENLLG